MAAYLISEVEVLDETQDLRHREREAASIARHAVATSFAALTRR